MNIAVKGLRFSGVMVDEDGTEHPFDQHFACVEKFEMNSQRFRRGVCVTTFTLKQKIPQVDSDSDVLDMLLQEYPEES